MPSEKNVPSQCLFMGCVQHSQISQMVCLLLDIVGINTPVKKIVVGWLSLLRTLRSGLTSSPNQRAFSKSITHRIHGAAIYGNIM